MRSDTITMERELQEAEAEIAALRAQLAEKDAAYARLDAEVDELRAITSELWDRDACLETDNERLRAECEALRVEVSRLRENDEAREAGEWWEIRHGEPEPFTEEIRDSARQWATKHEKVKEKAALFDWLASKVEHSQSEGIGLYNENAGRDSKIEIQVWVKAASDIATIGPTLADAVRAAMEAECEKSR